MFDYDGFIGESEQSCLVLDIPSDVTELVECYDSTLSTLLDKFAPQRQIRVKARLSAPYGLMQTADVAKRLHVSCRRLIVMGRYDAGSLRSIVRFFSSGWTMALLQRHGNVSC